MSRARGFQGLGSFPRSQATELESREASAAQPAPAPLKPAPPRPREHINLTARTPSSVLLPPSGNLNTLQPRPLSPPTENVTSKAPRRLQIVRLWVRPDFQNAHRAVKDVESPSEYIRTGTSVYAPHVGAFKGARRGQQTLSQVGGVRPTSASGEAPPS